MRLLSLRQKDNGLIKLLMLTKNFLKYLKEWALSYTNHINSSQLFIIKKHIKYQTFMLVNTET
jgi:hypothetical protein